MKKIFVLLIMSALSIQCIAQNNKSNHLDSLNHTREKPLWIVHISNFLSVNTYNLIFLRQNTDSIHDQTFKEQKKLHPYAYYVVDVYPKKELKFLNLKELCSIYNIPNNKMDLPIFVNEEMIIDPYDIIVDVQNIKSLKIEHNKDIDKEVIQIKTIAETKEAKNKREENKFRKEHPNEIYLIR